MLILGVQQNNLVIHKYVSILFQVLFPFKLLQSSEQGSHCYIVGPRFSILNIAIMAGKDIWYNLNFLKLTEAHFVAQYLVSPRECSMHTGEECVFSCLGMECSININ